LGVAKYLVRATVRAGRDAGAGGEGDLLVGHPERLVRDGPRQPCGQLGDGPGAARAEVAVLTRTRVAEQHGELVAGPAGDRRTGWHGRAQPSASLSDDQVLPRLPAQVVHERVAI